MAAEEGGAVAPDAGFGVGFYYLGGVSVCIVVDVVRYV